MPYVTRNNKGDIEVIYNEERSSSDEWLDEGNEEIVTFIQKINGDGNARKDLIETDIMMARVVEDLVDLLVTKGSFLYTELPQQVQNKLNKRKVLRQDLDELSKLINDDEELF